MSKDTEGEFIELFKEAREITERTQERGWAWSAAQEKEIAMLMKIIRQQSDYIEQMRTQYEYALRFVGFATLVGLGMVLWKLL